MKLHKNKKGSLQDLFFIGGLMLFFGLMVLFGFKITSEINNEVQAHDIITAEGKTAANTLTNYYPGVIDNSFLILVVGLSMAALILAALVRISPIFLALYIIALVFVILMCGVLSNVYQEIAANENVVAEADQLIFISNILTYLPLIVGVFGSILALIMYKSWRSDA